MQLLLVRHGESEANRQGIIQGHFDSPLSDRGLEQAEALAESLENEGIEALYTSDLRRAVQTADAISRRTGIPAIQDPAIREIDVGLFTGLSWEAIKDRYSDEYRRFAETGDWSVVPGAESRDAINERMDTFLGHLNERHPQCRIAVVAHGAILRRFLHLLLGLPFPSVFFELHNASYSEVRLSHQGPALQFLNRLPSVSVATASTRTLI